MTYKINNQIFRLNDSNARSAEIISRLNHCIKAIEKEGKPEYCKDLSDKTKYILLDDLERILFGIRGSIEKEDLNILLDNIPKSYRSMNVQIEINGNELAIYTPLTTTRKTSSSYYIASEIIASMKIYEMEHIGFKFHDYMNVPFHAMQIRKIQNVGQTKLIRDNNNEDAHIINAITTHGFHRSDNIAWMKSYTTKTEYVASKEDEGMTFLFTKSEHILL